MESQDQIKDSFVTGCGEYDLILKVQDRSMYVCKAVLCIASPVFKSMFQSDLKETNQQEKLPEKQYDDFEEFLSCFYPDRLKEVTDGNVYRILPYVMEYQVTVLQERCEKLLRTLVLQKHSANAKEIYRHLQLSEKYCFEGLKDDCIYLASELSLTRMDEGSSTYAVSDNSILTIRYLALKRKELDQRDDMVIINSEHTKSDQNTSVSIPGRDILRSYMNVDETSSCKKLLKAARLCLRYFKDDEEQISKLTRFLQALPSFQFKEVHDELELLPARIKQHLKIENPMSYNYI